MRLARLGLDTDPEWLRQAHQETRFHYIGRIKDNRAKSHRVDMRLNCNQVPACSLPCSDPRSRACSLSLSLALSV